jgi:DNA-binding winged helix-turn-helix (wHTH) protein
MDRKPSAHELADELASIALELRDLQQRMERTIALLSHAARPPHAPLPETLAHWLSAHRDQLPALLLTAIQASAAPSLAGLPSIAPAPAVPSPSASLLNLDPDKRVATIGARPVPLSQSEFTILELLWHAAPRPVSRRTMLDRLYSGKDEPNETVTDVFIYNIRQKLKNAGCGNAWIVGVRGIGWSLATDGAVGNVNHGNERVRAPYPISMSA